jgi:hypothetical protein
MNPERKPQEEIFITPDLAVFCGFWDMTPMAQQ